MRRFELDSSHVRPWHTLPTGLHELSSRLHFALDAVFDNGHLVIHSLCAVVVFEDP